MTKEQSNSKMWYKERMWRLTSSNFGTICHMTTRRDKDKLCEDLASTKRIKHPAVIYGKQFEEVAIENFQQIYGKSIVKSGLHVLKEFPFLAASPDGIVVGEDAVVEVKCPFSFKDLEITTTNHPPYLKTDNTNFLKLDRNHNYYYQIQGQLAISKTKLCYFIVYTKQNMIVEEIVFDKNFWDNAALPKLILFFDYYCKFICETLIYCL